MLKSIYIETYYGLLLRLDLEANIFYAENSAKERIVTGKNYHDLRKKVKALIKFKDVGLELVDEFGNEYFVGTTEVHGGKIIFKKDNREIYFLPKLYFKNTETLAAIDKIKQGVEVLGKNRWHKNF